MLFIKINLSLVLISSYFFITCPNKNKITIEGNRCSKGTASVSIFIGRGKCCLLTPFGTAAVEHIGFSPAGTISYNSIIS